MNLNYGVNGANEAKNVTGKIQDIEILLLNILRENPNVTQNELKGYLTDTCLAAQDKYKACLDFFRIKYNG